MQGCGFSVELRGVEPRTSSMRTKRATNCATAPSACPRYPGGAIRDGSVVDRPAVLEDAVELAHLGSHLDRDSRLDRRSGLLRHLRLCLRRRLRLGLWL